MKESGRHELACSRCGAPLHELKMLPVRKPAVAKVERELIRPSAMGSNRPKPSIKKAKKKRPRKSPRPFKFLKDAFEDAFEFVEDIFD
jgi:hypothetical protein